MSSTRIGRLGFHQVNIADDLFTADKGHCAAVCDEILRRGLKVRWTSFARVDTVSDEHAFENEGRRVHGGEFRRRVGQPRAS